MLKYIVDSRGIMDDLERRTETNSKCLKRKVGALYSPGFSSDYYEGYSHPVVEDLCCEECPRKESLPGQDYHKCPSIHAEADAILNYRREYLPGSILYTTVFPCPYCISLILRVFVSLIFYRHEYCSVEEKESLLGFLSAGGVVVREV